MLQAIARGFASIFKFDPEQPRAPAGTGNGGQWVKSTEAAPLEQAHNDPTKVKPEPVKVRTLPTILKEWSMGALWNKYQEAARHVIGDFNHDTWDMNNPAVEQQMMMGGLHTGAKGQMEAEAKKLLSAIEKSKPLDFPLYRGVHANDHAASLKVGDTFSESLAGWSSKQDWAIAFAHNKFSTTSGGFGVTEKDVLFTLKGSNMKGLSVSKYAPEGMFKDVDEWLTSGQYKVTGIQPSTTEKRTVTQRDMWGNEHTVTKDVVVPKVVEVERVGPATKDTIIKSEMEPEGYAHVFKFNPNHDPKNGQFSASGGPKEVKLSELEGVLGGMAGHKDQHPNIMNMSVDGQKPFGGEGLKVAREYMPQIPQGMRQQFLDSLHVNTTEESVKPSSLKPMQDQLDGGKVGRIYHKLVEGGHKHVPIVVSQDGYVLDGHHHWAGYVAYNLLKGDKNIDVFRVHMDHTALLDKAWDFAKTHNIESKDITKSEKPFEGFSFVFKYNPNHEPAGSPKGGQFAKASGGSGGAAASENKDVSLAEYYKANDKPVTAEQVLDKFSADERKEIRFAIVKAERTPSSVSLYTHDGVYTEERQKLHQAIIDSYTNADAIKKAMPADGQKPTFIVLGGRGGSGKSAFTNGTINEFDTSNFVKIDSDEIKQRLRPPYEGWNASCVHAEADELVNTIKSVLLARGANVIYDATLKSRGVESDILQAQANGYRIEGHYMFVDRATAATRSTQRYLGKDPQHRGRLVPVDVILGNVHNEENFDYFKKYFDKWSAYSNMGKSPELLGKGSK